METPELCRFPPVFADEPAGQFPLRCGLPDVVGPAEGNAVWGANAVAEEDGEPTLHGISWPSAPGDPGPCAQFTATRGDCWPAEQAPAAGLDGVPCIPEHADLASFELQLSILEHGPYDPDAFGDDQITTDPGGCMKYDCQSSWDTGYWTQAATRCSPHSLPCLPG